MKLTRYSVLICMVIAAAVFFGGCNISFLNKSEEKANANEEESNAGENKSIEKDVFISKEEDEKIKKLICDYYESLYSEPIDSFNPFVVSGKIPDIIRDFIAEDTLNMSEGNREIGIHLPRYVSFNGITAVEYEVVKVKGSDGSMVPYIEAECMSRDGENALYFVKVNLRTKCLPDGDFNNTFERVEESPVYTKIKDKNINENLADYIKLQAKYEISVKNVGGSYKIVEAREASNVPGLKNRLYVLNNDFVSRKPLINITKGQDGESYLNESEGKQYEKESGVIKDFFESLRLNLDSSKMRVFHTTWDSGTAQFRDFLNKLGQYGEKDAGKLVDLMSIDNNYKLNFDFSVFLLKSDMDSIAGEFVNFTVLPHPAYSQRRRVYIVTFDAPVHKINSALEGKNSIYRYDYFVTLKAKDDNIKIKKIELNECFNTELLNVSQTKN